MEKQFVEVIGHVLVTATRLITKIDDINGLTYKPKEDIGYISIGKSQTIMSIEKKEYDRLKKILT